VNASPMKHKIRNLSNSPLVQNFGWVTGLNIFQAAMSLFVGSWVARYLGPAGYGKLSYAVAFVTIASVIAQLGFENLVKKELVQFPDNRHRILGTAYLLKFSAALVIYCGFFLLYLAQPEQETNLLILLVGTQCFLEVGRVVDFWFQSRVEARYSLGVITLSLFVTNLIRIGLILLDRPLIEFAMTYVVNALLSHVFLLGIYAFKHGSPFKWRFDPGVARNILSRSWPFILNGLSVVLYTQVDQIMLAKFSTFEEVGTYSAAGRIMQLSIIFPAALASSFFPSLIRSLHQEPDRKRLYYKKYFALNVIGAYAFTLGLVVLGAPLILILFGDQYRDSVHLLRILSFGMVFRFLIVARGQVLIAEEFLKMAMISSLFGVGLNITGNYFLIPAYGAAGAAYTTLFSLFATLFCVFAAPSSAQWIGRDLGASMLRPLKYLRPFSQNERPSNPQA
jgi:O-antigen/teichoic acid export membrane protein